MARIPPHQSETLRPSGDLRPRPRIISCCEGEKMRGDPVRAKISSEMIPLRRSNAPLSNPARASCLKPSCDYVVMCLMCFVSYLSASPRPILSPRPRVLCARNGIFGGWRKTSRSVISESVLMWFQMIYQMVVSCGAETEGQIKMQAVWIARPLSLRGDGGMGRLATLS